MRLTFDEAVRNFDNGTIDLLHIDGRHFYEDVSHDFETWRPKLSENAVVLFHDIEVREKGFGVHQLWDELKIAHRHFEFRHGNGLGILGFGDGLPETVSMLMGMTGHESADQVRNIYSRLGKAVSDRHENAAAPAFRDEITELARQKGAFEGGVRERDAEIAGLREQVIELARQKGAFEGGVRERDEIIVAFREQVAELTRQRDEFEAGIQQRDAIISSLRQGISSPPAAKTGKL